MRIETYPKCCKARIICDFGAGHLHEDDSFTEVHAKPSHKKFRSTEEEIKEFLDKSLLGLQAYGVQVLFACPTNHQPEAIKALSDYGFFGAPQEELDANAVIAKTKGWDANGSPKRVGEVKEVSHYMVPMFYLVPPLPKNKVVNYLFQ